MPTSVSRPSIWRPAGSSDSLVDAGAEADATSERAAGASTVGGPDSPPNSPLPKRLRVRLEASKEKHSAHAHLERRLRLAERIQVRARGNPRFQGFSPITPFRSRAARLARTRAPSPRKRHCLHPTRIPRAAHALSPTPPLARVREHAPSRTSSPPRRGPNRPRVAEWSRTRRRQPRGFFCSDGGAARLIRAARLFAARLFAATAGFHASTYCTTRRFEVFTRS